jgi:hypothetical protein
VKNALLSGPIVNHSDQDDSNYHRWPQYVCGLDVAAEMDIDTPLGTSWAEHY